jgi:hypothetical protein
MILSGDIQAGRSVWVRGRGKQLIIEPRRAVSAAE